MAQGRTPASLDLPIPLGLSEDIGDNNRQSIVYETLKSAILDGMLTVGTRLPSSRTLALRWGLSRGTIEIVYDRLYTEGYIRRQHGSGTFVNATIPDSYLTARKIEPASNRPISSINTETNEAVADKRTTSSVTANKPFVARLADPSLFSLTDWASLMLKATRTAGNRIEGRSDPAGLPALRTQIADYLKRFRSIDCCADDVFITTGIRHSIDLISRNLIKTGDTICVENPCYPFAMEIFQHLGAKVKYLPVTPDGWDIGALKQHRDAKLVYVTPAHQSPLGVTMSVSERLALLDWANENDAIIIEDDFDSEFSYSGAPLPALLSIDRSDRTIYCGSFNKTVCADMRVGFIVARGATRHKLTNIWQILGRSVSLAEQLTLENFIRSGGFARHLRIARQTYGERRDCLIKILETNATGRFTISGHEAGFHFILWLKNGDSEADFCAKARSNGITLQPLSMFCKNITLPPAVLIGYAALTMDEIKEAGLKLAAILTQHQ